MRFPWTRRDALALENPSLELEVGTLINGRLRKNAAYFPASTLEISFGGNVQAALSDAAAASLLVFSLLYTPCVAALASIRRELGRKWVAGVIVWQCLVAWVAAFLVHGLALLF